MGQYYWPAGAPRALTIEAFVLAYETLGFRLCFSSALENGIEKIALFGKEQGGVTTPTHAALQLESGAWTSKLGDFEDIRHVTVDAVRGPAYGQPVCFLARRRPSTNL